eukprot:CAMPEP_0194407070 /NCGR_PEP_ID=MMETSP0176-20130528/5117_1 /TAXON_ID=216777 /ORGANISM="Proboscia alata, Strain PI-D3" /LENGTH=115 /DNA_ID=CAMNT_0039206495 /DNA_START=36 /DNA_END=384 /DNA_ORIENTATION=+
MAFVGGKLNLKGGGSLKQKKKKSKRSKNRLRSSDAKKEAALDAAVAAAAAIDDDEEDDMTDAERRNMKFKLEEKKRDVHELVQKSHRERVEEINDHLGSLTELNDIPRVSAAGNG